MNDGLHHIFTDAFSVVLHTFTSFWHSIFAGTPYTKERDKDAVPFTNLSIPYTVEAQAKVQGANRLCNLTN